MKHRKMITIFVFWIAMAKGQDDFKRFRLKEYFFGEPVAGLSSAKVECSSRNAILTTIKRASVHNFFRNTLRREKKGSPHTYYIGLRRINDKNNENGFIWLDNILLAGTYTSWKTNEPDNKNHAESCVVLSAASFTSPFKWMDVPCTDAARYICERVPSHIRIATQGVFYRFNNFHYFIGPAVPNYGEAENFCSKHVGIPAIIHDAAAQSFIGAQVSHAHLPGKPYSFFIGLKRVGSTNDNSAFEWLDETRLTSSSFTKWAKNKPQFENYNEWCVAIGLDNSKNDYSWRDTPCFEKKRVICQLPYIETTTNADFVPFLDRYEYHIGHPVSNITYADSECRNRQSRLAVIKTDDEQEFILNQTTESSPQAWPYSFLIGLKRKSYENTNAGFKWADGTVLGLTSRWALGEPNNRGSNERCVSLGNTFSFSPGKMLWKDVDCNQFARFVCQRLQENQLGGSATKGYSIFDFLSPGWIMSMGGGVALLTAILVMACLRARINSINRRLEHTEQDNHMQLELITKRREKAEKEINVQDIRASTYFDPIGTKAARKQIQKAAKAAAKKK